MTNLKKKLNEKVIELIKEGYEPEDIVSSFSDDRDDGVEVTFIPKTKEEFDNFIKTCPRSLLIEMGPVEWCNYEDDNDYLDEGEYHYLFPIEWYDYIPEGYDIIDINGYETEFNREENDNRSMYGLLSIGFIRTEN